MYLLYLQVKNFVFSKFATVIVIVFFTLIAGSAAAQVRAHHVDARRSTLKELPPGAELNTLPPTYRLEVFNPRQISVATQRKCCRPKPGAPGWCS